MENEEKKIRKLPILTKIGDSYGSHLAEDLGKEYYKVAGDPDFESDNNWLCWGDISMEVCVIDKHIDEEDIPHYNLLLRPAKEGEPVLYSTKELKGFNGKVDLDPFTVDMEDDIVKDETVIFLATTKAMLACDNKRRKERFFEDMKDIYKFIVDSIDVDTEGNLEFEEWWSTLVYNLGNAYTKEQISLDDIKSSLVYIVYGEFDPATRKDRRKANNATYEDDDEDEDLL